MSFGALFTAFVSSELEDDSKKEGVCLGIQKDGQQCSTKVKEGNFCSKHKDYDAWVSSPTSNSWTTCAKFFEDKLTRSQYVKLVEIIQPYDRDSFTKKEKVGNQVTSGLSTEEKHSKEVFMYVKGEYRTKFFAHLKTLSVRIAVE